MIGWRDGSTFPVDWYWAQPGAPILLFGSCASSNWLAEADRTGFIFEQPGAARPWRNGSRPSYVGDPDASFSTKGLSTDWFLGALVGNYPVHASYLGQIGFPYKNGRGIFPTFKVWNASQSLVSSTRGAATFDLTTPSQTMWRWPVGASTLWADWIQSGGSIFICDGQPWVINAFILPGTASVTLKCTSWNTTTGVSTWIDPSATVLAAGEVWTLTAP